MLTTLHALIFGWLGAITMFTLTVSPTVFAVLDGPQASSFLRAYFPRLFRYEIAVVCGAGPTATIDAYGRMLRSVHTGSDKQLARLPDPAVDSLSFWTDNGAYLFWNDDGIKTLPPADEILPQALSKLHEQGVQWTAPKSNFRCVAHGEHVLATARRLLPPACTCSPLTTALRPAPCCTGSRLRPPTPPPSPPPQTCSKHMDKLKYQRMMEQKRAIMVIGKGIPDERDVIWKNVCSIGEGCRECLIEMSRTKTKFYIVCIDLKTEKFHHIEMWRA